MATFAARPTVKLEIVMVLNEREAGALQSIAGYDFETFVKVFKEHLGKSYISTYEDGLQTLFKTVFRELPPLLLAADQARKEFDKLT